MSINIAAPNPESDSPDSSKWNSRGFRNQRKLLKDSVKQGQTKITEYFDVEQLTSTIDDIVFIRKKVNETIGENEDVSVKPILKLLYSNALKNTSKTSKHACRHDRSVKMFAAYLFCLIGRAGYEFLLENVGVALPSLPNILRMINEFPRIKEGEFLFNELVKHLQKWKVPMYIHVHMDDTRVLNKIEYDYGNDRYVGFVLPVRNGLPDVDAFVFSTFNELKTAYETTPVANYAHCIVAEPLTNDAPSFVFFVLGTDSKYDHTVILERWNHIEIEMKKRGVTIVSFGADGAGSFMKAMLQKTGLFFPTEDLFSKSYVMKEIANSGLSAQDHVHFLAKLRTKIVTPSNILVLGTETACLGHLKYILVHFSKELHQLTERILSNKDKQNYSGIEILLSEGVFECLQNSMKTTENFGTITYLGLMRDIKDSFLDKSLKPSTRLIKIWRVVFFFRIWRRWLKDNGCPEKDHFITTNAYVCAEINAHLMLQIISGVIRGKLPVDALRVWITGSQGCEALFRLARSMTSTFSTIVNFSMKGILERMHKLNFLSTMECSDDIAFPRVKKRLLQCKEESEETFELFPLHQIDTLINQAKDEAITMASKCGMLLDSFEDSYLLSGIIQILERAVDEDGEDEEYNDPADCSEAEAAPEATPIFIQEDLTNIRLTKESGNGLPMYTVAAASKGTVRSKTYSLQKRNKTPFILYSDRYIRKTTALYLLQENVSLSNDRLLRVRQNQLSHIHDARNNAVYPENHLKTLYVPES